MFRKIKKVFCCSMILSLVVSSLAFAASLPNYYGKNYTYTKSKTIAKMEAEGNNCCCREQNISCSCKIPQHGQSRALS